MKFKSKSKERIKKKSGDSRTYLKIRLGMAEENFASGKAGARAGIPERYISRAPNAARHEMRSVPMECGGASGRAAFCKRGHSDCYATRLHALLCQRDARTMLHANFEIGSRLQAGIAAERFVIFCCRPS